MVMKVKKKDKKLHANEIAMMERFANAFPTENQADHKQNLITIVNFADKIES